jgi:hypothetical protein
LALIVFIPGLTVKEDWAKWLSVSSFIAVIPLSVSANLILRELEVFNKSATEKLKGYHHNALLYSLILYLVGFASFCYAMQPYLLIVFSLSFFGAVLLFRAAQNEIKRS